MELVMKQTSLFLGALEFVTLTFESQSLQKSCYRIRVTFEFYLASTSSPFRNSSHSYVLFLISIIISFILASGIKFAKYTGKKWLLFSRLCH